MKVVNRKGGGGSSSRIGVPGSVWYSKLIEEQNRLQLIEDRDRKIDEILKVSIYEKLTKIFNG